MLDQNFIKRKLKLIAEELDLLEVFRDYTIDELAKDSVKMAAAERFLERIVIRAADINNHLISELGKGTEEVRGYRDAFVILAEFNIYPHEFAQKIAENAKFRNILVHEYNGLDKNLIHKKIKEVLTDFKKYSKFILEFIERK